MYKFARLRALLRSLSVGPTSQRQMRLRWLWTLLGYAALIGYALAEIFRTSHDWPITWQDVVAHDVIARSFLLSSYIALMTGISTGVSFRYVIGGAASRTLPPPEIAPALRSAVHARDSRAVSIEQVEHPAQRGGADDASAPPAASFQVAAPELLTRPLALALVTLAGGMFPLALAALSLSFGYGALSGPYDPSDPLYNSAQDVYMSLRLAGIFAPLVVLALVSAWRFWIRWRASVRGAEALVSAEGLTIRDQETLWRERFIPWRQAESLARFTYNDDYVRPRTVYLLDAGSQTFLWESPPDTKYASPARRARTARQQEQAARLLALIGGATGLPLLNISSVVSAIAKVEPDPYSTSDEPGPGDAALIEFLNGATAKRSESDISPPTRAEQWRRLLVSLLAWLAMGVAVLWLSGGLLR